MSCVGFRSDGEAHGNRLRIALGSKFSYGNRQKEQPNDQTKPIYADMTVTAVADRLKPSVWWRAGGCFPVKQRECCVCTCIKRRPYPKVKLYPMNFPVTSRLTFEGQLD